MCDALARCVHESHDKLISACDEFTYLILIKSICVELLTFLCTHAPIYTTYMLCYVVMHALTYCFHCHTYAHTHVCAEHLE